MTDTRFFFLSTQLQTISSRLSRFQSEETLNRMFTRVRSTRDGQRTRVFIDGIRNFFEFFFFCIFFIILILYYLCSSFLSLSYVCFTFGQQNRDNGFVLLHKYYVHRNVPRFERGYCFFPSKRLRIHKKLYRFHT